MQIMSALKTISIYFFTFFILFVTDFGLVVSNI